MATRNKNGKETATVGKPKYAYAGFNKPFAVPTLIVEMTPAQEHRQNIQVAWLQAAIDAQDKDVSFDERENVAKDIKELTGEAHVTS